MNLKKLKTFIEFPSTVFGLNNLKCVQEQKIQYFHSKDLFCCPLTCHVHSATGGGCTTCLPQAMPLHVQNF
jgi:hypothetical protein